MTVITAINVISAIPQMYFNIGSRRKIIQANIDVISAIPQIYFNIGFRGKMIQANFNDQVSAIVVIIVNPAM